jgi:outer membrane receptor protein involved in Fe transport
MSSTTKIALTPLAAAVSAALAPAGSAQAQQEGATASVEEIVVTARKREENLQDIPASIQAIPQIVLEKMGANGLEDYTRFIPDVNVVQSEPGSSSVIFRGVYTGGAGVGQSPASVYFDELPVTTTGDQPEIRMVDIARVEALIGPQGTLFGGSAQSGTLRIISNQPDPSQFEGIGEVTVKQGEETAFSHQVSGVLNLPFAEGKAALRLVGFTATDAGFIDNVYGHTPDTYDGVPLYGDAGTEDNAEVVKDDWNETDFVGGRANLRYEFNDEWAATVGYMYQKSDNPGARNEYDPFVGDLKTVKFNTGYRTDEYDNISLRIEGDLGWAQLVSATNFYDRKADRLEDSTVYTKHYMRGACRPMGGYYFQDPTTGNGVYYPRYCFGPTQYSDVLVVQQFHSRQEKFTQELRLAGGGDNLNWILGLFYESTEDKWQSPWGQPTNFDYQDSISLMYWENGCGSYWGQAGEHAPGASFGDPRWISCGFGVGFAPDAEFGWHSNSDVEWSQAAIFGEATWRINDQWTATVGARAFDRDMDNRYFVENPNTAITARDFINNGPSNNSGGTSDVVPKISVSYHVTEDKMVYVMYNEGFRSGGVNAARGAPILSRIFEPDKLKNFEVGAKTRWANGRVQANLTYYDMNWDDYQLQVLDPSYYNGEPWQQMITNAGTASVTGFTLELNAALNEFTNIGMNLTSLESETSSDINLNPGNPSDPDSIEIPSGTRLPLAPEFKAAGWIDVNWQNKFLINGDAFARVQFSHTGDSVNQIAPSATLRNPQVLTPSYGIADFRIGVVTESEWQFDFFISNFTDERAVYSQPAGYFEIPFSSVADGRAGVDRIYTNRPREYGLRISKRWTD